MRRVLSGIDTISEWSGKVLSVFVLIIMSVILWEITSRYVFKAPTIWAHELTQYLFATYAVLSGAYVLLHNQHVRVDVIYARFSPRRRAILDLFTYLVFFLFIGVLLVWGIQISWHSVKILEPTHTPWAPPLYPLKLMVPLGALLILLQGLAHFVRALSMAIRGRQLA